MVGLLALQGDFDAHRQMLSGLGADTLPVRTPEQLQQIAGLIIPGGESTTIGKLMERIGLDSAIRERAAAGMPIYGTCAGMILMAKEIENRPEQARLGLMDICVARNAFGRQIDSFEADIPLNLPDGGPNMVHGVFIRAPYVVRAEPQVTVFGRFREVIVAVRQGNLLATAFHPELTDDPRMHALFLDMIEKEATTRV